MGTYVYRITSKRVVCSDGLEANVAVFAYKPSWSGGDSMNRQMEFKSGCHASFRLADNGKLTGRVVYGHKNEKGTPICDPGTRVLLVPASVGVIYDSTTYPAAEAFFE